MLIQSLYMYCSPPLSLAPNNISLRVSAVTTTSITVFLSGPSGEVSYEKAGSSDGPTNVPYSTRITISDLTPNTRYTITYTVQNSYGTKMTKVRRLTIPEGESVYYGSLFCHPRTLFTMSDMLVKYRGSISKCSFCSTRNCKNWTVSCHLENYYLRTMINYLQLVSSSYNTFPPLTTAPTRLLLEAMSRAVTTTWTAPTNHKSLVYHVNYSSPLAGQNSTTTSGTTLILTGLHPYEEYTISVQAGNKGGLSVPETGTTRTYSDSEFNILSSKLDTCTLMMIRLLVVP